MLTGFGEIIFFRRKKSVRLLPQVLCFAISPIKNYRLHFLFEEIHLFAIRESVIYVQNEKEMEKNTHFQK